jgi:hypothetical protein
MTYLMPLPYEGKDGQEWGDSELLDLFYYIGVTIQNNWEHMTAGE